MNAEPNNFSLTRIAIRSREEPSQYCASCDTEKDKGYRMFCMPVIGTQAVFICDDCLKAAKKHTFLTNGKPKP